MDETWPFYPSVDLLVTPIVLATRLLRVSFSQLIAPTYEAADKNNYTVTVLGSTTEVDVLQVSFDPDADVLSYVDLYLGRPVLGTDYQVEATGLQFVTTGSVIGDATGRFIAVKTKVDSILSNMSHMYDTSVSSNLFHIFAAIGISDEEIGGERIITTLAALVAAEAVEGSTYGTATYGTDTYGG